MSYHASIYQLVHTVPTDRYLIAFLIDGLRHADAFDGFIANGEEPYML